MKMKKRNTDLEVVGQVQSVAALVAVVVELDVAGQEDGVVDVALLVSHHQDGRRHGQAQQVARVAAVVVVGRRPHRQRAADDRFRRPIHSTTTQIR